MDGSGTSSYNHPSKEFCISGIILTRKDLDKLNIKVAKITKKYFGDDEIILHYVEVSKKIGVFKKLKDPKIENRFWSDLISLINPKNIFLIYALVDKLRARSKGWLEITIAERAYEFSIRQLMQKLETTKVKGQIITESDVYSDIALINVHNTFQSKGIADLKIIGKDYHKTITSLSFVNKHNLDSAVQLADLLGSIARLKYRIDTHKPYRKTTKLQTKILRLINRKVNNKEGVLGIVL